MGCAKSKPAKESKDAEAIEEEVVSKNLEASIEEEVEKEEIKEAIKEEVEKEQIREAIEEEIEKEKIKDAIEEEVAAEEIKEAFEEEVEKEEIKEAIKEEVEKEQIREDIEEEIEKEKIKDAIEEEVAAEEIKEAFEEEVEKEEIREAIEEEIEKEELEAAVATELRDANLSPFCSTSNKYDEADDLELAVKLEFGDDAEPATWEQVVEFYNTVGKDIFVEALGMKGVGKGVENSRRLISTYQGEDYFHEVRKYFILRFDGDVQSGWLYHEDVDNKTICLGSSYNFKEKIVAYIPPKE